MRKGVSEIKLGEKFSVIVRAHCEVYTLLETVTGRLDTVQIFVEHTSKTVINKYLIRILSV